MMKQQILAVLVSAAALFGAAACDGPDSDLEDAAEEVDEAVDELD